MSLYVIYTLFLLSLPGRPLRSDTCVRPVPSIELCVSVSFESSHQLILLTRKKKKKKNRRPAEQSQGFLFTQTKQQFSLNCGSSSLLFTAIWDCFPYKDCLIFVLLSHIKVVE